MAEHEKQDIECLIDKMRVAHDAALRASEYAHKCQSEYTKATVELAKARALFADCCREVDFAMPLDAKQRILLDSIKRKPAWFHDTESMNVLARMAISGFCTRVDAFQGTERYSITQLGIEKIALEESRIQK